jgi:hypothetical protein
MKAVSSGGIKTERNRVLYVDRTSQNVLYTLLCTEIDSR